LRSLKFKILPKGSFWLASPLRAELLSRAWNYSFDPESNVVDVTMGRLRKKLNRPGLPVLIYPRRGLGYCLGENVEGQ